MISKQPWSDAYDEKFADSLSRGHSQQYADDAAIEYANDVYTNDIIEKLGLTYNIQGE